MRSSNRLISTLLAAGLLLGAAGPALAGPAGVKAIVDDFNNDKRSDVAILNVSAGPNAGLQFGYLLTDPGFTLGLQNPIVQVPTGWVTLGFGDYNSDGIVDVVLQDKTGGAGDGLIFIFLMNNNLTPDVPNSKAVVQVPSNFAVVALADVNGDKNCDIVLEDTSGGANDGLLFAFIVNTDLSLDLAKSAAIVQIPSVFDVAAVKDLDGDMIDDIMLLDTSGGANDGLVFVFLLELGGSGQPQINMSPGGSGAIVQIPAAYDFGGSADSNGDGKSDLQIVGNSSVPATDGFLFVFLLDGTTAGGIGSGGIVQFPAPWVLAGLGDYDGVDHGSGAYTSDVMILATSGPNVGLLFAYAVNPNLSLGTSGTVVTVPASWEYLSSQATGTTVGL
jgi:hypothetical protein